MVVTVHQLKISLEGVEPIVWRRVQLRSTDTLARLHEVIQIAMGWENYHLHRFEGRYGNTLDEQQPASTLSVGQMLCYTYDFGDNWQHLVEVEKILTNPRRPSYPTCTAGRRACPPEDSGGPYGYYDMLKALRARKGWRYQQVREQLGTGRFDPAAFDMAAVNDELARLCD